MKRLTLTLVLLFAVSYTVRADINTSYGGRLPTQGTQVGGKGADGFFHYLLLGNDGSLSVAASSNVITTTTPSNASLTTTSSTVLAANANRKDAAIVNYGATGCFLTRGATAV